MTKQRLPVLLAAFILLFLAAWLPRIIGMDQLVTVDEPKWLTRSANFYQAIGNGQANDTYQSEHPGVTIMWAGTLGFLRQYPPTLRRRPDSSLGNPLNWSVGSQRTMVQHPWNCFKRPAGGWSSPSLPSLQVACFRCASSLDSGPPYLISLFVAWDPFYIALSRQLHPDGLLASFIYLSLLLFLAWLYGGQQRRFLILSGVAMGLAWLTKTPAILLTAAIGLLAAIDLLGKSGGRKRFVLEMAGWAAVAVVTALLLWPVLWTGPLNVWSQVTEAMRSYVSGHENPAFFMGRITDDPGLFFYPLALLMRWTLATLLGLIGALILTIRFVWPMTHQRHRRAVAGLLLFVVIFLLGMSLGNKQFDRYALPAFLVLDVIATLGLIGLAQAMIDWLRRKPPSIDDPETLALPARAAVMVVLVVIVVAHGLPGLRHAPAYLTYYNPLLGGIRTAEKVLMVGWGEGLKEAADWLNKQPGAESAGIVSWYRDGSLSYYLDSQRPVLDYGQIEFWADADYAVVYVNQRQRRLPMPRVLETIESGEPVHVVTRDGVDLVRIYDRRDVEPPEWSGISEESAADFGGGLALIGHSLGDQAYLAGDSLLVRLYLKSLVPDGMQPARIARLIDGDGNEIWRDERDMGDLFEGVSPSEIVYDHLDIQLPEEMTSGQARLLIGFVEPSQDARSRLENEHLVTPIDVRDAVDSEINIDREIIHITGLCHEPELTSGEPFVACFYADGQVDGTLKASIRLIDPGGRTMAQADEPIFAETQVVLMLPEDAGTGAYTLAVVIYDPDTLASYPDQNGDHMTNLSTLNVQ